MQSKTLEQIIKEFSLRSHCCSKTYEYMRNFILKNFPVEKDYLLGKLEDDHSQTLWKAFEWMYEDVWEHFRDEYETKDEKDD